MNIEELREHCLSIKGASESFPFKTPGAKNMLVFKVMEKMFAYIDIAPRNGIFQVWMKCDYERAITLANQYSGIEPSTRKTAKAWVGATLDSDLPDELIRELVNNSVEEVIKGLPRKKQKEYLVS